MNDEFAPGQQVRIVSARGETIIRGVVRHTMHGCVTVEPTGPGWRFFPGMSFLADPRDVRPDEPAPAELQA